MKKGPVWTLTGPYMSRPRGKVRRLLQAGAIAAASVCASAPLAACNYKGCRYDDGDCYERPDGPVPDLAEDAGSEIDSGEADGNLRD